MKKFVLLFVSVSLFYILCSNKLVFAQDDVTVTYSQGGGDQGDLPLNVIKWNPWGVIAGQYQFVYERALNEKMSVQLSAGYITFPTSQTIITNSYEAKTTGFIVIPEFRYYITNSKYPAPKGFYLAPFARIRAVTQDLDDINVDPAFEKDVSYIDKVTTISGGVVLGGQALIADVLSLDFFIGPQYKTRNFTRTYDDPALNAPYDPALNTLNNTDYELVGDEEFDSKYIQIKIKDKSGLGVRAGFIIGFAF